MNRFVVRDAIWAIRLASVAANPALVPRCTSYRWKSASLERRHVNRAPLPCSSVGVSTTTATTAWAGASTACTVTCTSPTSTARTLALATPLHT